MSSTTSLRSAVAKGDALLTRVGSQLQSFVLLLLRITWGWQLVESGYGHLTHLQKTIEAFKGWGCPSRNSTSTCPAARN